MTEQVVLKRLTVEEVIVEKERRGIAPPPTAKMRKADGDLKAALAKLNAIVAATKRNGHVGT